MIPAPLADALSAYRLTRLVTADTILRGWRDGVVRRTYITDRRYSARVLKEQLAAELGIDDLSRPGAWSELAMADDNAPKLATLITCRWCAGTWVSLFVVAARRYAPRLWDPLAQALAMSAGAALLARLED